MSDRLDDRGQCPSAPPAGRAQQGLRKETGATDKKR
jgi:hypothetical protein